MLKEILQKYYDGSGQQINLGKSSIIFSTNAPEQGREEMARQM